jgi:hypothetical protein
MTFVEDEKGCIEKCHMWSKKQSTKDPVSKIMTNSELTNCELLFC